MPTNAPQLALPTEQPTFNARERINALDVVRGLALCGILVVNIPPITRTGADLMPGAGSGTRARTCQYGVQPLGRRRP